MILKITKDKNPEGLLKAVQERTGVNLNACYQCRKCSMGCPVADRVDAPPSDIIRRLQLGAGDELLRTELIWTCLSCETCYERCPNKINFPAIIDALKPMTLEKGIVKPEGNAPLFNETFLKTVKTYGRVYDLQAIAIYKLGTGSLKSDMDKFPAMLRKGKMAIFPPSGADTAVVKRIFAKKSQGNNKK